MKTLYSFVISASIVFISFSSCKHDNNTRTYTSADMPIEVSYVSDDSITLYKSYPATLTANRTAPVLARVNGYVSGAKYTAGDYVNQGQTLFTIASSTYANNLQTANANLDKALSDSAYSEEHYKAVYSAYKNNAVSQMELAQALNAREQNNATVKSGRAALAEAQSNVAKCTVKAPISGHITNTFVSGGSYVSGEASPVTLATIYDDDYVLANFTIEDASFMRMFDNPNNRDLIDYSNVPVIFPETLPHQYTANLYYLAPNVDASTGTMKIQAKIKNEYNELKSGMYCNINMPYKVDPHALLVRDASICSDQSGKYIYIVNDSDKVVYTPITIGELVNDTMRIVTKGLKLTDRYVTSAMLKVRDGLTVKPYTSK